MAKRAKCELSVEKVKAKQAKLELPVEIVMAKQDKLDLPLDIILHEILTRLPVKTLSRFRSVSKLWCYHLSQPLFQKEHHLRSLQRPLLLVTKKNNADSTFGFSTYDTDGGSLLREFTAAVLSDPRSNLYPIQSCLGLVCFRSSAEEGGIIVCNPSTKEMITLPSRPEQDCDICYGFGYTTSTEEFKMLRFFTLPPEHEDCRCEIFTLGSTDGWRETKSPPPFHPCLNEHLPLLHGALHFLPCIDYDQLPLLDHYIAVFDLDTEEYRAIPLPGNYFEEISEFHQCELVESRGSLCMVFDLLYTKKMLQIWFLKDYHSAKWVNEHNIDISSVTRFRFPIAIAGDGSILMNIGTSRFYTFDLCYYKTQEKRIMRTIGTDCWAMFYIESFLSLGSR